jgi:hypothetical protein
VFVIETPLRDDTVSCMGILLPPFIPEPQGNRLESYEVRNVDGSDHQRLYLCGPDEIAEQVLWMLQPPGARKIKFKDGQEREWSHRIHVDGPLPESATVGLELLRRVLTLPRRSHLDVAIALDLYKKPDPALDSRKWPNTPAGSMVNAAKYWGNDEAFDDLVNALARVVREHKIYSGVDYVASVPGHDTTKTSFGERLAVALAKKLDVSIVSPRAVRDVRPAAKERETLEATLTLEDEFAFGVEVSGRVVLIVDDVYRTGRRWTPLPRPLRKPVRPRHSVWQGPKLSETSDGPRTSASSRYRRNASPRSRAAGPAARR